MIYYGLNKIKLAFNKQCKIVILTLFTFSGLENQWHWPIGLALENAGFVSISVGFSIVAALNTMYSEGAGELTADGRQRRNWKKMAVWQKKL